VLFQEAPAATTNYMIAGYAVIFGVLLLYILSLALRQNNLKKDLEILQEGAAPDEFVQ
jgi:CcmD family protein